MDRTLLLTAFLAFALGAGAVLVVQALQPPSSIGLDAHMDRDPGDEGKSARPGLKAAGTEPPVRSRRADTRFVMPGGTNAIRRIRRQGAALDWLHRLDASRFGWLEFDHLDHLVELDLSRLSLDPDDLVHLVHLVGFQSLGKLNLRGTGLTDEGLIAVGLLKNLKHLDLTGTLITDGGLKRLEQLTRLDHLRLTGTGVGDAGLETLGGMSTLTELWLDQTKITNRGLAHLKGLVRLRLLALGGTRISKEVHEKFRASHPRCRVLR